MKYEIVKFSNGKFGLRRRSFIDRLFNLSGTFRDFKPTAFYSWRKPTQEFFQHCQTDDLKELSKKGAGLKMMIEACLREIKAYGG